MQTKSEAKSPSVFVRGKRMKPLVNQKSSDGFSCQFNIICELQRHILLGTCIDKEQTLYVFQWLLEFDKSYGPFKDTIISYDFSEKRIWAKNLV